MVTLEPILVRVELRETAHTVTFVYSYYERGEKQLKAIELPYSHWRLMDHNKVHNVGAQIIDMDTAPILEDDSDIYSASEPTFELGSN